MSKYKQAQLSNGVWVVTEDGRDYLEPSKCLNFAFDTETFAYIDGKLKSQRYIYKKLKDVPQEEKRRRLSTKVWAWQVYDEVNGFFMTNDFLTLLVYQCRAGHKVGWCYNAKFDFSQIDYKILAEQRELWKPHIKHTGKGYNKGQPFTFESVHNDQGARYAYKLWVPYKKSTKYGKDSHTYTHAIEYRDFMNLFAGGLKKVLESLDVKDNDGTPIRKLEMNYQSVDTSNLKEAEIDYCCNDVKGLYFAVKKFNEAIEEQSDGERHIFGDTVNVMTAGGFAKAELLRSMYPKLRPKDRIKQYQRDHPITKAQDKYFRNNHLYRGGICLVNKRYQGKLLTRKIMGSPMYRYDVNSEYPFAMNDIQDLVGKPIKTTLSHWLSKPRSEREGYEAIYILKRVTGKLKSGFVGVWYDPIKKEYVDEIDEEFTHLIFERELNELSLWYDLDFECETVLLYKRGGRVYAPFVLSNYELKAAAKKVGNIALSNTAKLKLNSSYGKLAERITRTVGHYELSKETGAIHFVVDGEETEEKSIMNVAVGALITSVARCLILKYIREVCKDKIAELFVYIDTDSIHAFAYYDGTDPLKLGALKLEATCEAVKYLAPKTYIDIERISKRGYIQDYEAHSKGINIRAIKEDLKGKKKHTHIDYIDKRFAYGQKFTCLVAMNVKGGKVLVPTDKELARIELAPDEVLFVNRGYDGSYLSEI